MELDDGQVSDEDSDDDLDVLFLKKQFKNITKPLFLMKNMFFYCKMLYHVGGGRCRASPDGRDW